MFSDSSSFELYNSVIVDSQVVDDELVLKCLYMKLEPVNVIFEKVSEIKNYTHLKGNTLSYLKTLDDRFEVYFVNEMIEPAIIKAKAHRIEWK